MKSKNKKEKKKKPIGYILPDGSAFFVAVVPTRKNPEQNQRKFQLIKIV